MHPLLEEAVTFAKARRSLSAPKSKDAAKRRAERYERLSEMSGSGPVSRIAQAEAGRQRAFAETGKYGRGGTPGRAEEEKHRADGQYRSDVKGRRYVAKPAKRIERASDGSVLPVGGGNKKAGSSADLVDAARMGRKSTFRYELNPATTLDQAIDAKVQERKAWYGGRKQTYSDAYIRAQYSHGTSGKKFAAEHAAQQKQLERIRERLPARKDGESVWYRPTYAASQFGLNGPDRDTYNAGRDAGASGGAFSPGKLKGEKLKAYERGWATGRANARIKKAIAAVASL